MPYKSSKLYVIQTYNIPSCFIKWFPTIQTFNFCEFRFPLCYLHAIRTNTQNLYEQQIIKVSRRGCDRVDPQSTDICYGNPDI